MTDWWSAARHGLWIIGAAIVVASWSAERSFHSRFFVVGAGLFCAGMALVSRWWEAVLWLAVPAVLRWKVRK